MGVLLGFEMVCWDIIGKVVGKLVYELLGGRVYECLWFYIYFYLFDGDVYLDLDIFNVYNDLGIVVDVVLKVVD